MIDLNAYFDGKVLVPDEPLQLVPNRKVRLQIEPIDSTVPSSANRIEFGLQEDLVIDLAPDWQDPLPDDIWLHNTEPDAPNGVK